MSWAEVHKIDRNTSRITLEQTILSAINTESLNWAHFMLDRCAVVGEAYNNIGLLDNDDLVAATTFEDLVSSAPAMAAVAGNRLIMDAIIASPYAMDIIADNPVSVAELYKQPTAGLAWIKAKSTVYNRFLAVSNNTVTIGKAAVILAGLNPDLYEDMNAVAANSTAMAAVVASSPAMIIVAASPAAMTAVAASSIAMTAVAANSTAMAEIVTSSIAMTAVAASSAAMAAIITNSTAFSAVRTHPAAAATFNGANAQLAPALAIVAGLDPAQFQTMDAIVASSTAMDAVTAISTAMLAVAASSTAMTAVVASPTAFNAVRASPSARHAVTASASAIAAIAATSRIVTVTTSTALGFQNFASNVAFIISFTSSPFNDFVTYRINRTFSGTATAESEWSGNFNANATGHVYRFTSNVAPQHRNDRGTLGNVRIVYIPI